VNPSADITPEELEVFLQEADEQLQLLDEDFVALEKEGANAELLQEIFRAAHTLKGSSAMVGFESMARVAHAMEALLERLRNGTLAVSTPVINALLYGLDVLKSLRNAPTAQEGSGVDVESVVVELEKAAGEDVSSTPSEKGELSVDPEVLEKLGALLASGYTAYKIKVEIDPESSLAPVRSFQVLNELSQAGEVLSSVPSREEIEEGKEGSTLELLLATLQEVDTIEQSIAAIPDIDGVEVIPYALAQRDRPAVPGRGAGEEEPSDESSPALTKAPAQKLAQVSQTVRVDVKLLDMLMNLVGEMVIDRNRISQIGKVLASKHEEEDEVIEALVETSAHIMKVVTELQESILQARMLPIGTVFNGFPRLVRDLAQKTGKKVDFIIEGRETELDRTIIEQIRDPLIHLLRNAVDHGIESPEKRRASGKPEESTIRLMAYQEQNHIIISVEDDGRGIDAQVVRDAAVKKGLKSAEEAAKLPDAEAINLIFASGFSTAESVTEVSGRGVGLDVVKTNIHALGGSVTLEGAVGRSAKFTIRLPLTLAIINGLLVSSSDAIYVIPMSSMVEVLNLKGEDVTTIMGTPVIRVRGNILPLLRLDVEFDHQKEGPRSSDQILVVVVRAGGKSVGLAVDSVMEPQEIVVKSLGEYMGGVKGIAGATLLGDGHVALILDTATLVMQASVN
jgi:two-component system chemotaxis sensor kinase CheA